MISRLSVLERLVIFLWTVRSSFAVPPDYCLHPLNNSDCGEERQPVFSYYKPRSLCEIEFWQGCPTFNRFENEVTCSHVCIGRLGMTGSREHIISGENTIDDWKHESEEDKNGNLTAYEESCHGDLNKTDCNKPSKTVYTYDHKRRICTKATWKGCKTTNKYHTELRCMDLCMVEVDVQHWDNKIKNISKQKIDDVIKVVDDIIHKIDVVITSTTTTPKTVTTTTATSAAPVTQPKLDKLKHAIATPAALMKTTSAFKIPDSFWSDKSSEEGKKKESTSDERVDEVIIA